jgi:two-component system nitrogen regulation sensor histidine kinase NtrY
MERRARAVTPTWSRDNRSLAAIALALGLALAGLYALFLKTRTLTPVAATNRVLLFVLFYFVVLLILILLFVIVRSAVRLFLESRRGVFGSRFRVRVVATNVGLALLPIALLVLPTTGLLQKSVEQWFAPAVEETVRAGREVSDLVRVREGAFEARTGARLRSRLARVESDEAAVALLQAVREESGVDLVEWRRVAPPGATPLAVSSPRWPLHDLPDPGPDWIADATARGAARRIEQAQDGGQAARTLLPAPNGVIVVGTYDPPLEAGALRRLSEATSAYAMLQAERSSLAAIQVLLFLLLAFLVLLASVWVGLLLARRVTRPIAALSASARRIGAGDFDAAVEVEGGDEIAALSGAFNSMTAELRRSRAGLVKANEELLGTNRRLDEERRRVRTILAHVGAGVVAFADDRTLLALNETARHLLAAPDAAEGGPLEELFAGTALEPLREFLRGAVEADAPREATLSLSGRVIDARVARVPAQPGENASWVVTLEDTTALMKAERAAAWEEAARRMAHEIKNPLTPIRLAAERMRRRAAAAGDRELHQVVEEGASTIIDEVSTLSGLVDSFGRFARLPATRLEPADLGVVVAQVAKLFGAVKPGVTVTADVPPDLPAVRADAEQVKRLLVNLVDNAVAATPTGGAVSIRVRVADGKASLAVADDGPGIPAADRGRVFDPSFSTKERGTGLGLSIAARIAAEHAGRVTLEENAPHGCRFVFEWPSG